MSSYLSKKYNFSPDCKIVAFTGDNLDSLAGLGVQPDDLIVRHYHFATFDVCLYRFVHCLRHC